MSPNQQNKGGHAPACFGPLPSLMYDGSNHACKVHYTPVQSLGGCLQMQNLRVVCPDGLKKADNKA
eukprot:2718033-Amphidinium_carterae.1